MLRLLRCDQIQGYLIARPQPLEQLTRFAAGAEMKSPVNDRNRARGDDPRR
jgi:EAL domain-containing protein (putative c-di-GMP-specific phosphodiesterase class I)